MKVFGFLLCSLFSSSLATAQPLFPARGADIIDALVLGNANLAHGDDDQRRNLTRMILEQLVCEFPQDTYTWKSADAGRPPSKDALGRLVDGRLWIWDWQNGSTRGRMVVAGQPAHDVTGQHPIAVGCVNHLAPTPPAIYPPESQPRVVPPPIDDVLDELSELQVKLVQIEQQNERIYADISAQVAAVTASLEAHREEARKTRNTVLGFLGNWRNWIKIAAGIVGGLGLTELIGPSQ